MSLKAPFLDPNPLTQLSGPENIAWDKIDGKSSWALWDSGLTTNAMTSGFVEACSLDIGALSDLDNGILCINGFWEVWCWPLGCIIIRIQVEGVQEYDDQVALVVPDSTIFRSWELVTLGTPTINWIINMMKESKINDLLASLNGLRMAWLLACWLAELSIQGEATMHQTVETTNLKEAVKMTKNEEIDAFFFKNKTWPNENHAPCKQHVCNNSDL